MARLPARRFATRPDHFFGVGIECEPRGQIVGTDPGEFLAPTTDVWVLDNILSVGRFKKGANWSMYKDAAVARGANPADFVETAPDWVEPVNSAVHPFLSLFDVIICNTFQHGGMTPRDCKKIKDLAATYGASSRPFFTARPPDIMLHGWKDDMPSGYHSSTLWNHYYEVARDNDLFMRGTQVGTQGSWMCDPEETLAWPNGVKDLFAVPPTETAWQEVGSGHNWHLDYTKPNFAEIMAAAALAQYNDYWSAGGASAEPIDHYMVHDIVPRYPARSGTATNLPTKDPTQWYAATQRIPEQYNLALHVKSPTIGKVWTCYGAAWDRAVDPSSPQFVHTVGGIYYNYQWSSLLSDERFVKEIRTVAETRIPIMLGCNVPHASLEAMFTTPNHPAWMQYLALARVLDWAQNVYLASCNELGYLYWTPAMRPL